jgi:hypothetical protein
MAEFRRQIILDYAKWTALSALRSGAPIKSRAEVYPLLDAVAFSDVLSPGQPIQSAKFDAWHERQTAALCARHPLLRIGWAAKLINVYLKTCPSGKRAKLGDAASLPGGRATPVPAGLSGRDTGGRPRQGGHRLFQIPL